MGGIVSGSDSVATLDESGVLGRRKDAVSYSPPSPRLLFGCMEGSLRKRRCSHCFAISCLPDAEDVLLVVGAIMFNVAEGTTGEDVGH
jgi:hypothetical protein